MTLDSYRDCPEAEMRGRTGRAVGAVSIGSLKEAAGVCGGRSQLWDLNRLWVGSCCIEGSCVKSPLLMLIDILLRSLSMFTSSYRTAVSPAFADNSCQLHILPASHICKLSS